MVAVVIVHVPADEESRLQVPVPVAAIVVLPPGSVAQATVLSGPALGFAVTTTAAVSRQAPPFHWKR